MKPLSVDVSVAVALFWLAHSATGLSAFEAGKGAGTETLAALQARLTQHIAQPRFAAAAWGIKVVSLDTGKTLFEHQAQKLLKPDSVAKLYTGALSLAPGPRPGVPLQITARPSTPHLTFVNRTETVARGGGRVDGRTYRAAAWPGRSRVDALTRSWRSNQP